MKKVHFRLKYVAQKRRRASFFIVDKTNTSYKTTRLLIYSYIIKFAKAIKYQC